MATLQPPLGIRQLIPLDCVNIRQKTTVFINNKYVVLAPDNTVLLYAREDSSLLGHMFGGKNRAFHIDVYDTQDREVISLRRPYTFGPDKMDVTVCGQLASVVRQEMTLMKPVLNINDAADRPVLRVKGPLTTSGVCDYDVYTHDKVRVGVITKKWGGIMREVFTHSDQFQIRFPRDLDVRYKAALIGTSFLIDFLYYEN